MLMFILLEFYKLIYEEGTLSSNSSNSLYSNKLNHDIDHHVYTFKQSNIVRKTISTVFIVL